MGRKIINFLVGSALLVTSIAGYAAEYSDFDQWITKNMTEKHVPGVSLAIIDQNRIVYAQTYTTGKGINVSPDSLFQSSDITKSLLTVSILQLIEEGKFDFDTPLKDFSFNNQHTVGDLLLMDDHIELRYVLMRALMPAIPPLARILQQGRKVQLGQLHYQLDNNKGWGNIAKNPQKALQRILELATGKALEEYMNYNAFMPMQMKRTRMMMQDPLDLDSVNSNKIFKAEISTGGMWSTATDISKFLLAVSNSSTSRQAVLDLANQGYSLGFDRNRCAKVQNFVEKLTHSAAVNNYFIFFPEAGQGMVVMTNSNHAAEFINQVVREIGTQYHWAWLPTIMTDQDDRLAVANCKRHYVSDNPMWLMLLDSYKWDQTAAEASTTPETVATAVSGVQTESAVNEADLVQCQNRVTQFCQSKTGLGLYHCGMQAFAQIPQCALSQRILKETGGLASHVKHYTSLDVVQVENEYFILTNHGELIALSANLSLSELPQFVVLKQRYPELLLLPLSSGFPQQQMLTNNVIRLLFQQKLAACSNCKPVSEATVAYDFTFDGKLLSTKIVKLKTVFS